MDVAAQVNWLDIIVLAILVINGYIAYRRGFIITIYRLSYLIITFILTKAFYPVVSNFIRYKTNIYTNLVESIGRGLSLDNVNAIQDVANQMTTIKSLPLPSFITSALIENNNYEVKNILGVQLENFGDYISAYLANISINIISMLAVFIVISIGLKIAVGFFDLIAKLPVLNSINKLLGLGMGLILGILMIWIGGCVITLFYTSASFQGVVQALESSYIAKWFYNNNFIAQQFLHVIIG